ncbi:MAG: hypothetical protein ACLFP8_03090 [Alphaproteobacteria bacterium]
MKKRGFFRRFVIVILIFSIFTGAVVTVKPRTVQACGCGLIPSVGCNPVDFFVTLLMFAAWRIIFEAIIKEDISWLMNREANFIVGSIEYDSVFFQNLIANVMGGESAGGAALTAVGAVRPELLETNFFSDFWYQGVSELTRYLNAYGMYQLRLIGGFFDARNQIETTRLFFRLQAEAHRDYHPSDDFCWIGSSSKSLAATENRSRSNMLALSRFSIDRQLGRMGSSTAVDDAGDKTGRWHQFTKNYCDPKDNGWAGIGTGLDRACDHDGAGPDLTTGTDERHRVNIDIDYTRLIESKRTLDVNFTDNQNPNTLTDNEEDVLALSANLYGNHLPSRTITREMMRSFPAAHKLYLDQRTVVARRNVALNSFNAIVAMKSAGTGGSSLTGSDPDTGSYIAALMRELMPEGTSDEDIIKVMGENPSYYAQLEVLGKKMYESPRFFARLYDTPANIQRKSVAMKAIELMLDRALFESELRQEMLLSVMLSTSLDGNFRHINKKMTARSDYK